MTSPCPHCGGSRVRCCEFAADRKVEPNASKAKRGQRKRQRDRLRAQVAELRAEVTKRDVAITGLRARRDDLRRAITEHRTTIDNAGTVRVDSRDEPAAAAKHAADERLWATLADDAHGAAEAAIGNVAISRNQGPTTTTEER